MDQRCSALRLLALGLVLALATTMVALPGSAFGTAGDLDPTFSGNGTALGSNDFGPVSVAIDSQGRTVVAGASAIDRFMPNGNPDGSFSGNGRTRIPSNISAKSIAIDSRDRILAAGEGRDPDAPRRDSFAVERLKVNGTPDPTFSGDGQAFTHVGGPYNDKAEEVAIDRRGRIVLAGVSFVAQAGARFAIARFTPRGSLDRSFSDNGRVATRFPGDLAIANSVAIDSVGRIIAAGESRDESGLGSFALARYTPGGALDPAFSGDGKVTTRVGTSGVGWAVATDDSNRLVVGGEASVGGGRSDFGIVRYRPNGDLDRSFSGDGRVLTSFGQDNNALYGLAIDGGQRIVAAGSIEEGDPDAAFGLARYTPAGALDPAFSGDGRVTTSIGPEAGAQGVTLNPRGRIVAAGITESPRASRLAVARYLGG